MVFDISILNDIRNDMEATNNFPKAVDIEYWDRTKHSLINQCLHLKTDLIKALHDIELHSGDTSKDFEKIKAIENSLFGVLPNVTKLKEKLFALYVVKELLPKRVVGVEERNALEDNLDVRSW
jgi:hypothetical protein